ncbi:hypothetical protein ILUMI_13235 [Ignelater luminosus]|uniref:Major facilitator superfamily (MFS) profile domain-containing protein n=1 Tax=Ignelater luminosus TaxID=2038154 RepID=A0A8K0CWM1_IGNLU|nr:hypothetical protein ILUMI_13235 [Ignelater luminosus]
MHTDLENCSIALVPQRSRGKKLPQYVAALSVCMGALAAGAVLGWTGNISEDMKKFSYNGIEIDDDSLGWIGSMATLGAAAACIPIGKLCDMIGRKIAMLSLAIPFTIGWMLIIFANSLTILSIGRFLTGMAGCAFCVSAPIYTSEIAEKDIRGALGSYFEFLLATGIALSFGVAMITDIKSYTIIMAILPLIFVIIFMFQPESPIYLLKLNKEDKARAALLRLRGNSYDIDAEIREIKNDLLEEQNCNISPLQSLRKKGTKISILVCFSLMFFQQACGITAVVFYADSIFTSAGSKLDPKVSTLILGLMEAIATFAGTIVVDRLGRRILLISSTFVVGISGAVLGIFFTLQDRHLVDEDALLALGYVPVISLCLFVIMFSIGIGPIPWLISAELFPPEIRSIATGAAATLNWFTGFLITKFYLDLKNAVGSDVTFYIFSVISVIGTVFIFLFVPETKGKSLNEIQKELNEDDMKESIEKSRM